MDGDEVLKAFDAEFGEGHDTVFVVWPVDPDQTVLGFHFDGDFGEPVFIFTEFPGDECDSSHGMDFVDVHCQAAIAEGLRQFHGSNSSRRLAGCSAIRASTSVSQACGSTSLSLAVYADRRTMPSASSDHGGMKRFAAISTKYRSLTLGIVPMLKGRSGTQEAGRLVEIVRPLRVRMASAWQVRIPTAPDVREDRQRRFHRLMAHP